MTSHEPPASDRDGLHVVDHGPSRWFLLADGDALLLDVHCSHSAFDYSVLVELTDSERTGLERGGRAYLDDLAQRIHHSAPAARGSTSPYRDRDLTRGRSGDVVDAVRRWRAAGAQDG
ncbi:hypothetical protein [Nocardioides sp. CFH 31398]|uniref:hypothetical protein n=1 Tax=Nocardioides sp. CFH 31398 TaxID=2919579 RepID=UPI001F0576D0|nr:hypothetical protein [Nocardioides sp. CFH 31398]MCH1866950.1 hypothetical protein [Nocardioides sp. CFH 31398]